MLENRPQTILERSGALPLVGSGRNSEAPVAFFHTAGRATEAQAPTEAQASSCGARQICKRAVQGMASSRRRPGGYARKRPLYYARCVSARGVDRACMLLVELPTHAHEHESRLRSSACGGFKHKAQTVPHTTTKHITQ